MAATLQYRLPMSCVRFEGTHQTRVDGILDTSEVRREGIAELAVIADPRGARSIDLEGGRFKDVQAAFKLTGDGRLTSATATVEGRGSVIVSGVIGIASSILALGLRLGPLGPDEGEPEPPKVEALTDEEIDARVEAAYLEERPAEAAARRSARDGLREIDKAYRDALASAANVDPGAPRLSALRECRRLGELRERAELEVDRANAKFAAWRDGTITVAEEHLTYIATIDDIRRSGVDVKDGELTFPAPGGTPDQQAAIVAAQAMVRTVWDKLGLLVLVAGDAVGQTPSDVPRGETERIAARFSRPVTLGLFQLADDGKAVLTRREPADVVDSLSNVAYYHVQSGLFSKRSGGISFSVEGIPSGFEVGMTSDVAGAIGTVAGLPAGIASSLESMAKVSDQIDSLRGKGAQYELDRAKRELELKRTQLEKAGLSATERDFAELQRLQQEVGIAEANAKLGRVPPPDPITAEIAELRRQVELLRLRRQVDRLGG